VAVDSGAVYRCLPPPDRSLRPSTSASSETTGGILHQCVKVIVVFDPSVTRADDRIGQMSGERNRDHSAVAPISPRVASTSLSGRCLIELRAYPINCKTSSDLAGSAVHSAAAIGGWAARASNVETFGDGETRRAEDVRQQDSGPRRDLKKSPDRCFFSKSFGWELGPNSQLAVDRRNVQSVLPTTICRWARGLASRRHIVSTLVSVCDRFRRQPSSNTRAPRSPKIISLTFANLSE
jgi:hypothetical protein